MAAIPLAVAPGYLCVALSELFEKELNRMNLFVVAIYCDYIIHYGINS